MVRPSNKHLTVQLVEARSKGDRVVVTAHSSELRRRYKWRAAAGNLPSAYLTGLLAGLKASKDGLKKAILDIGLKKSNNGSRVYAALKGALDAGLDIPHGKDVLPKDDRITGKHIAGYVKTLKPDQETIKRRFAQYFSQKLEPEDLPKHFEEVKAKIIESFSK